ncbi:MAG TPA: hypothetical protein EYP69_03510 [Bacteroidales bacterium]|nr:hypothetical protein [Bacteroidales bacterium]
MNNFKFFLLFLGFVVISFISCNTHEKEMQALQLSRDSLLNQLKGRDSTINVFFESFNEIQDNLATIKEKEQIINMNASGDFETNPEIKDQIQNDIQSIYSLLQKNKERLNYLQKQLRNSNIQIKALKQTIDKLMKQIQDKDAKINTLKEKLENMNIQINILETNVDSLKNENMEKDETILQKENELNTAFYVFGTQKELKNNGIITKEGGFIGIGKIAKLRNDFNKDYFTKIDIRTTQEIPLACKKAQILTTHPAGSYELITKNNRVEKIVIKDTKEFWRVSKYLVIVIE